MPSDADADASTRAVDVERQSSGSCGFHLTRSRWDPYPWVAKVDTGSPADTAGMRPGNCVLEINGEDIVGKRICEVADRVRSGPNQVSLLLWSPGTEPHCTPESLCCGPMPQNLQRLSACMSSILAVLECPVCLDTIPPPAHQCDNGHLICLRCRAKTERCPVCRLRLSRGRSLLAEQVYNSITDAFNLREESEQGRRAKMQTIFKIRTKSKNAPDVRVAQSHTNKFLARLVGKSTSVDNLSNGSVKPAVPTLRSSAYRDFETSNLKAKSRSTSEIFKPESPATSRAGSYSHLNNARSAHHRMSRLMTEPESSPASCHGSFESLDCKVKDDSSSMTNDLLSVSSKLDRTNFQCPYKSDCTAILNGRDIFEHFQEEHDGPYIQYFQPKIRLSFATVRLQKYPCFIIHAENMTFFLRILAVSEDEGLIGSTAVDTDILLWMWCLEDVGTCNKTFQVEIINSEEQVLLSVTSSVHSLATMPCKDIVQTRRGVFLTSSTMKALGFSNFDIFLDIEILKTKL